MICPHCHKSIPARTVRRESGKLLGSITGERKARTTEQARAAANARWAMVHAGKCMDEMLAGRSAALAKLARRPPALDGDLRAAWLAGYDAAWRPGG